MTGIHFAIGKPNEKIVLDATPEETALVKKIVACAVAAEREACAKVAEEIEDSMADAIAERIRGRGQ